jgi:hypothetical protein
MLELRSMMRPRKTLVDERTASQQGIQAQVFHHGVRKARACSRRRGGSG